jgi:predicted phosphodiesterase
MKIAALADIHGNYHALITVLDHVERWKPDLVVVLGDTINRGPRSRECLHLIQQFEKEKSWYLIKGNHEEYVLEFDDEHTPRQGLRFEMQRIIFWTYQQLSSEEIQAIKNLPSRINLQLPGGAELTAVHASTQGIRVGIYPKHTVDDLKGLVNLNSDIFLVGHTHQPLIRSVNGTLVINAGSIGLPFDGDQRTCYAQIIWRGNHWLAEMIRLDYDLEAARKDFYTMNFIPEGGPLADLVLTELDLAWPQLSHWFRKYERPILNGNISIKNAVEEFQKNPHREYKYPDPTQYLITGKKE